MPPKAMSRGLACYGGGEVLSRARRWLQPVICRAANVSMVWWRMEAVGQVGNPALLTWLIASAQRAGSRLFGQVLLGL